MARVKNGVNAKKKHKKILKQAKGFYGMKSKVFRAANPAVMRSLRSAYIGRKNKKREYRRLWIARINAGARMNGISYSKMMNGLKLSGIEINRKMLSEMAIKTRNAVILAPHPKARQTNFDVTAKIREVLKKFDAPEDLVQAIDPEMVSVETSWELMQQCDFILATGGTPMVKQAYSSGTPAIGVGTGNVVSMVDGTVDMDEVADKIIRSKTFDNATSCSTENNIIVFESCYDEFVAAMAKRGGNI